MVIKAAERSPELTGDLIEGIADDIDDILESKGRLNKLVVGELIDRILEDPKKRKVLVRYVIDELT